MSKGSGGVRIGLDAMGGDLAPMAPVEGAIMAVRGNPALKVTLVGSEAVVRQHLGEYASHPQIAIHGATEVISMDDEPVPAVRKKRHSSMVEVVRALQAGTVDAVVSAGNTGALMASGMLHVGRMQGVERPALTAVFPSVKSWGVLLLDVGANLEPKPSHLVQYALLGSLYCQEVLGIAEPAVGLLNVGVEEGKGPRELREAYGRLKELSGIRFVGNIEARELLQGRADVVVCGGFVGNVALKLVEGVARDIFHEVRGAFGHSWGTRAAGLIMRPHLREFSRKMDYQTTGGAPLLGLNGIIYKCHGSSEARAFAAALDMAYAYLAKDAQARIRSRLLAATSVVGDES